MTKCPECGNEQFKRGACNVCGHNPKGAKSRESPTGRTDCIVSRDCDFKTGEWTCQWGAWASNKEHKVYCEFHQSILKLIDRHGPEYGHTEQQWEILNKDREYIQKSRSRRSWAYPDGTFPDPPFWFKPIAEQWKMLTGLPVPVKGSTQ